MAARIFIQQPRKAFLFANVALHIHKHTYRSSAKKEVGFVKSIWGKLFGKYLLTTNVVSAGFLMVAGDIMSQAIEQRNAAKREYDYKRIFRMFMVGSLAGPLHHYFYKWMDDIMPLATTVNAIKKILLDQFIMSPACILLFFYPACLLENKTLIESNKEIKEKFMTVYIVDWSIWPAVQFINFYYLHPKYRVIYVNVITMLYNIFLSYVKHKQIS